MTHVDLSRLIVLIRAFLGSLQPLVLNFRKALDKLRQIAECGPDDSCLTIK